MNGQHVLIFTSYLYPATFTSPSTHPPRFLTPTYNVNAHTGQIDGWKCKLLIATLGNARVWAEKAEPFLPTPASLCHFIPQHPLWSPYPGLPRDKYGMDGWTAAPRLLFQVVNI